MQTTKRKYFKHGMVAEDKQSEVFNYWLQRKENSYPELSERFGISAHQVKWVIEKKMADRNKQSAVA